MVPEKKKERLRYVLVRINPSRIGSYYSIYLPVKDRKEIRKIYQVFEKVYIELYPKIVRIETVYKKARRKDIKSLRHLKRLVSKSYSQAILSIEKEKAEKIKEKNKFKELERLIRTIIKQPLKYKGAMRRIKKYLETLRKYLSIAELNKMERIKESLPRLERLFVQATIQKMEERRKRRAFTDDQIFDLVNLRRKLIRIEQELDNFNSAASLF